MSDFDDKLRLKGNAEEDMYFARRDRERIEALHEGEPGQKPQAGERGEPGQQVPDAPDTAAQGVSSPRVRETRQALWRRLLAAALARLKPASKPSAKRRN